MCIPHGVAGSKSNGFVKEDKPKKHIKKVSQDQFEKGDPDFKDERVKKYAPEEKASKGWLGSLLGD